MTLQTGCTLDDLVEANTERTMMVRARYVVVLADHTMWGRIGLATVARLPEVHTLVTDNPPQASTAVLSIPEVVVARSAHG